MMRSTRLGLAGAAAAMLMASGHSAPMMRPEPPQVIRRVIHGGRPYGENKKARERARAKAYRRKHALAKMYGQPTVGCWSEPKWQAVVNRLTQHERSYWAAKGYPGLREKDTEKLLGLFPGNPRIQGWPMMTMAEAARRATS